MTAGVVIILGPTGMNLGSGMTGGLVYVLKDLLATGGYNREFVHCANACGLTAPGEEASLRSALEEHVRQTSSPRAMRLLEAKGPLPLLRLEPVHPFRVRSGKRGPLSLSGGKDAQTQVE